MNALPKLVAVDMDGTFLHADNTYDRARFDSVRERMVAAGCTFCVASGNQYYQLRSFFPYHEELSFVAENGAFVKHKDRLLYAASVPRESVDHVIDACASLPEVQTVLCGVNSAWCQPSMCSQEAFDFMSIYYTRIAWTDDLHTVDDQVLKFALAVPEDKTYEYYDILAEKIEGHMIPVTSGHGSIDLILPGVHKAAGLQILMDELGIAPEECVAFGDGGNDIEMLQLVGTGYAMANAPANVKDAADAVCPSNEDDGVTATLDRIFPA